MENKWRSIILMTNKYIIVNLFAFILLLGFGSIIFAQKKINLTRSDVVIDSNKPSIYLCIDENKNKDTIATNSSNIWLRIYNNTIWTIKFNAQQIGASTQKLKLSNGSVVRGLSNKSTSYPNYEFESIKDNKTLDMPQWSDITTANWLLSNNYTVFRVPSKLFDNTLMFISYKYEWELIGSAGQESYSPTHRVYFHLNDSLDISKNFCQ
jgi:hypothetical protein